LHKQYGLNDGIEYTADEALSFKSYVLDSTGFRR
jgi:hypothetical protein